MSLFRFFPLKVARRFITFQVVFVLLMLASSVLSIRYFVSQKVANNPQLMEFSSQLDVFTIGLAWVLFFACAVYTAWITYIYFYPLDRILEKAKNIKRGTYKRQWDQEVESGQDFGEWYELELTLNKIHREIKNHKQGKKRREIELEALAGAVSDGIIAIDPLKRVEYFNGQMALILGKVFDPLSPPSYLDEVFRAPKLTLTVDDVIATGQPRRIQIVMRPHKVSEGHHTYDVVVTPVKSDKKQKFYGVIAVFHDITEAKKVEEVRIDFVANASHELKTPLTSIKGYVDALSTDLDKQDVTQAQEKLAVIEKNVNRLNDLVKDLLTLSRLDSAEEALKEDISTEEFSDELYREFKGLADAKQQTISVDVRTPMVKANRMMLGQTLSNLIENAIKYSQAQATIRVLWEMRDQYVVLKVKDNGPGVSEEHLNRLFERFYRVQYGKARSGVSGTGLGLSIAKNCMLRHGGYIEVDSLPGRGTEFTCFFPKS